MVQTQSDVKADLKEVLSSYLRAWNEPDPIERAALLERTVADDVLFVDPMKRTESRRELDEHIADVREKFPGVSFQPVGELDEHNGFVRQAWIASGADGLLLRGLDVDDVGRDGRLTRILGFFEPA